MLEFAIEDVGKNLHIAMRMAAEAFSRRDYVVVKDAQRAPIEVARILISREAKRVARVQPAMIERRAIGGALNAIG